MDETLKLTNKELKELNKWQREKKKSKPVSYLAYMFLLVTIVYICDEICSQINVQMQSILSSNLFADSESLSFLPKVIRDLFGSTDTSSARLALTNTIATTIFGTLAVLYKPLSDRFGRKVFLIINTFGMGLAMIIISLSTKIPVYFLGECLIAFFTPHDMQATYIYECSPKEKKGIYYSIAKFFATIGMMLIGILRTIFIKDSISNGWRYVYLIPGIITIVVTVLSFIFIRETDTFIDSRIKILTMSEEEKIREIESKKIKDKNGGFFRAIFYIFKHKQLMWCVVCYGLICIATIFTQHYENTINIGAALKEINVPLTEARSLSSVSSYVNKAILVFPIGSALIQLSQGFVSDKYGRRMAELIMGSITLVMYILFYIGTNVSTNLWNPYLIGILIGIAVGSFWALGDIIMLIVQESVPTYMRSSVVSATTLLAGMFSLISDLFVTITSLTSSDRYIGLTAFFITAPAMILCVIVSFFKVKENKTVDLNEVSGEEYD